MIDVYYNPILPKPWLVRLCSIDYNPILKLTQPDSVLSYPKVNSDWQETFSFGINPVSLLCPVVGYSMSMIYPVYALSGCDQPLGFTFK